MKPRSLIQIHIDKLINEEILTGRSLEAKKFEKYFANLVAQQLLGETQKKKFLQELRTSLAEHMYEYEKMLAEIERENVTRENAISLAEKQYLEKQHLWMEKAIINVSTIQAPNIICPITCDVMINPVIIASGAGYWYEAVPLAKWLSTTNHRDPRTRRNLTDGDIQRIKDRVPNFRSEGLSRAKYTFLTGVCIVGSSVGGFVLGGPIGLVIGICAAVTIIATIKLYPEFKVRWYKHSYKYNRPQLDEGVENDTEEKTAKTSRLETEYKKNPLNVFYAQGPNASHRHSFEDTSLAASKRNFVPPPRPPFDYDAALASSREEEGYQLRY